MMSFEQAKMYMKQYQRVLRWSEIVDNFDEKPTANYNPYTTLDMHRAKLQAITEFYKNGLNSAEFVLASYEIEAYESGVSEYRDYNITLTNWKFMCIYQFVKSHDYSAQGFIDELIKSVHDGIDRD